MSQVEIDDLLKKCASRYKLVILAAKRAKEVAEGAPALIGADRMKVTSIALEEIRQGKVFYKSEPVPGLAKTGRSKTRGGKTKTEKKRAVA